MREKILILSILLITLFAWFFMSSKFKAIQKSTSNSHTTTKIVPSIFVDETKNWKTYKGTSYEVESVPITNISFKYPPNWSFKQEYAHATVDLSVFFTDQEGKKTIAFIYSELPYKDGFYDSQSEYLGEPIQVKVVSRSGYMFKNKYGYIESYYFPLKKGHFSIQLLDAGYKKTMEQLISTVFIN